MTLLRYAEVALYSLLNFLPYMLLAVYPFRRRLRFSRPVQLGLICLMALIQIGLGIAAVTTEHASLLSLVSTLLYAAFYFLLVQAHFGKSLFTLLMLSNIANLVVMASKCLEGFLFPALAMEKYHFSHCLTMFLTEAAVLIPLYFYFTRIHAPALQRDAEDKVWRYLWLIPAVFYLIWYQTMYFSGMTAMDLALRLDNTILLFLINAGALLIYYVVVLLTNEQAENLELHSREQMLRMQQRQYDILQDRIMAARRIKHDLRQHLHVINAYINDDDREGLREYIRRYESHIPYLHTDHYCDNFAVNALLQYFAVAAQEKGTAFSAAVALPKEAGIPDEMLTVLLGNLLENAVEATGNMDSPFKTISVRGTSDAGAVFFHVTNSFQGKPKKDSSGLYMSTKHDGRGVGLRSVRNIASRYDGLVEIHHEAGEFSVSVMLTKPE